MKRISVILLCAISSACGISEVGSWDGQHVEDTVDGVGNTSRRVCCVTGIDYPGDYDWADNPSDAQARCSLVVFADGIPAMKLAVGDGYEVSSDPESHRMSKGDLYTFFSKNGASVVKKNGRPLFRYAGDEILADMLIIDGDVHTLTAKRSGGFAYRMNGQPFVERMSGSLFGKLWRDGDHVCFAFSQPVALSGEMEERYYLSVDSEVIPVEVDDDVGKVWDICSRNGAPVCLGTSLRWRVTMVYEAGNARMIGLPPLATMLSCTMFTSEGSIGVECVYSYPDGSCESGIWVEGAEYIRFEAGLSIFALCYSEGSAYCVLNPGEEDGMIFDDGRLFSMPAGYSCAGSQTVAVSDDEMYVAMSSRSGGRPVIWHEGVLDTLRMNGYVCSVSFSGGEGEHYP